jgi:general secretion pathway protein G
MKRSAFTMVELVFVIVILGILGSIAIPRLAASRGDAQIVRYKTDVSTIRSAIATTRSVSLLAGDPNWPALEGPDPADADTLFEGVLPNYPIQPRAQNGRNGWEGENGVDYVLTVEGVAVAFTYDDATGRFTCVIAEPGDLCSQVTQ